MTLWIAIGILVLGVVGGVLWRLLRPQNRGLWLAASWSVTLAWLIATSLPPNGGEVTWLPWRLPATAWEPPRLDAGPLGWPWTLLTLGLTAAVLLSAVRYAANRPSSLAWMAALLTGGLLLLGALAANRMGLVLIWALADGLALVLALRDPLLASRRPQAVALAWARSVSWVGILGSQLAPAQEAGWLLGLAVVWRLLWQPWEVFQGPAERPAYGIGVLLRQGNVLITLAALRFGVTLPGPLWAGGALLAGLLMGWAWALRLAARGDLAGAALGVAAVALAGPENPPSVWAGLAALALLLGLPADLGWGWPRLALPAWGLALLALWQLPFTPGASALNLWAIPGWGARLALMGLWAGLSLGLGRRVYRALRTPLPEVPLWSRWLFPLGVALPALGAYRWSALLTSRDGWSLWPFVGGAIGLGFSALEGYVQRRWRWLAVLPASLDVGAALGRVLGTWLWRMYRWAARLVAFFTRLLEGEGGVLWAIVLLSLLAIWMLGGRP